jgi:transcriptional regulator with XRE-family HTH domain
LAVSGDSQPHGVLRARGVRQAEVAQVTYRSNGYVSEVLRGSMAPDPAFVDAVSAFLDLRPEELFTEGLLVAVDRRRQGPSRLVGRPSGREGPYGRQPAYWLLRSRGIRQEDLIPVLGRSRGHVSAVLNGFSIPDAGFATRLSELLGADPGQLFTSEVLYLM